ncbi:MAG: hypothetical protein KC444_09250 [Nitrosopumilus sp.]|nr:hypothetical protein [Nitrosopumilus sp.]
MEVKDFRTRLQAVKIQFYQFQSHAINSLAKTLILETMHNRMRDFGYSDKIIQGTAIAGVDVISARRFRIFFHSEYFGYNGFDVALAREKNGTVDHIVKPAKKKALTSDGTWFSKGHEVSGIIPSHIIERTLDEIAEPFLDEYRRSERSWLEQNFGGTAIIAI